MCSALIFPWLLLSPQWFTLKDTESGRVHFRLEWLSLLPSTDHLEQVAVTQRTFSFFYSAARSQSNVSAVFFTDPEEKRKHYEQSWGPAFFSHLGRVRGQG